MSLPFYVDTRGIFQLRELHLVKLFPWEGHKISQLNLQWLSAVKQIVRNQSDLAKSSCNRKREENFKAEIVFTFPPPLGPTRAILEPGLNFNDIPCRLNNVRYEKFVKIYEHLPCKQCYEIDFIEPKVHKPQST